MKDLISIIGAKKNVLICMNAFTNEVDEIYKKKLVSFLKNKSMALSYTPIKDVTESIHSFSNSTADILCITNIASVPSLMRREGINTIFVGHAEHDEYDCNFPDMRSLYAAMQWALSSQGLAEVEGQRKVVTIIPAAGKGTRLEFDLPKILYPFADRTALDIMSSKVASFSEKIVLIASPEGKPIIEEHLKKKDLDADILVDSSPHGNAGSVAVAMPLIKDEDTVLVIWGDQIGVPKEVLRKIIALHQHNKAGLSFPTRLRKNPYIHLERDEQGKITKVLRRRFKDDMPAYGENELGVFVLSGSVFKRTLAEMKDEYWKKRNALKEGEKIEEFDFLDIIPECARRGQSIITLPFVFDDAPLGFNTAEEARVHIERLQQGGMNMENSVDYVTVFPNSPDREFGKRNNKINQILCNMERAIFLDRDGTLNEDVGYAKSIKDIKIFPDTPGALRQFKELGYSLIVITNQAVISRGWLTEEGMDALHGQYNEELERLGSVPIDFFYFCPHHPNADTPQYRKICECRKPGHALITKAAKEHSIDLSQSWMIGDKITDIVAGKNAGCRTILIRTSTSYETNVSGKTVDKNIRADYEVGNIAEAAAIVRGARRR